MLRRDQLIDAAVALVLTFSQMRAALATGGVSGRQEATIAGYFQTLRADHPRAQQILSRIFRNTENTLGRS